MTKITSRQVATLKRNAMSVYPLIVKRDKLNTKIAELLTELEHTNSIIEATETGSRIITGGINSTDLIQRVVVNTGKEDLKGQPIKVTKWEPIPDKLTPNEDGSYTVINPRIQAADDVPNIDSKSNNSEIGEACYSEPLNDVEA